MKHVLHIERIKLKEYLRSIYSIIQKCTQIADNLLLENPKLDTTKDVRLLFFLLLREEIQSYFFSESLSKKLINRAWYYNNGLEQAFTGKKEVDKKFMLDRLFHFGVWTKTAFCMGVFYETEHTLRTIAEEYDDGSCDNRNIRILANNLIDNLRLNEDYKELWSIFAFTRNTIHSGGFHKHPDGGKTLSYKGKSFEFKKGKPIDFLSFENTTFIISEILELLKSILSHPDIAKIPLIIHPHADVTFRTN